MSSLSVSGDEGSSFSRTNGGMGMSKKVYFSKIEFREYSGYSTLKSILLLNLVEGTLAYQVYEAEKRMYAPAITGVKTEEFRGHTREFDIREPAMRMRNGKTGFKSVLLVDDIDDREVVFSYTRKLSECRMKKLLPLCNALDFEPYRDRKVSMNDEGYCGYRDEIHLCFTGVTDSYIPKIELSMDSLYDEEHIWPSEKLYRYIIKTFMNDKKLKK